MSLGVAFAHGPRSQASLWKENAGAMRDARWGYGFAASIRNAPLKSAISMRVSVVAPVFDEGVSALPLRNDGLHHVSTFMSARRHPLRRYIVTLFERGDLVSVREATLICDASRQAVSKWLRVAGINIEARRLQFIARRRSAAMVKVETGSLVRRPSKTEIRKQTEKLVKAFNRRKSPKTAGLGGKRGKPAQ